VSSGEDATTAAASGGGSGGDAAAGAPANSAPSPQNSTPDDSTTLVGNDSMGSASGDTTLAAGDHGDTNDSAQEAGSSIDVHLDDPTDNLAEVVVLASNISYVMLAGGRPSTHVLCIPFGEFFLYLHLHTQLLSINPLISRTDWIGQQEELNVYAAMACSLLDILTLWDS
jgi:hypothetical protein